MNAPRHIVPAGGFFMKVFARKCAKSFEPTNALSDQISRSAFLIFAFRISLLECCLSQSFLSKLKELAPLVYDFVSEDVLSVHLGTRAFRVSEYRSEMLLRSVAQKLAWPGLVTSAN